MRVAPVASGVLGIAVMLGGVACKEAPPREGQVVVYVDTDARLSSQVGLASPLTRPLFERLRVDVYPPGATEPCSTCVRELPIDDALVDGPGASFGIVPAAGVGGYRVRIRLVHSDGEAPRADSTLDGFFALPVVHEGDLVTLTTFLPLSSLGAPIGSLDAPVQPSMGHEGGHAGSFAGSERRSCTMVGDGACVPGGMFWMGDPTAPSGPPDALISGRRLVILSPFYVDRREVTVGEFRAWLDAGAVDAHFGSWDPTKDDPDARWCSFSRDGARDDLPMSCVEHATARAYCQSKGGDLPTEAQLEWMTTALWSARYPWGNDDPTCADAVTANVPTSADTALLVGSNLCHTAADPGGPKPVHRASIGRDAVRFIGVEVRDLAGNVSELARDDFASTDGPCWTGGILRDPLCAAGGDYVSLRGGSWVVSMAALSVVNRSGIGRTQTHPAVGFRCVRPG
jgi:formylglycine-generating enzyme